MKSTTNESEMVFSRNFVMLVVALTLSIWPSSTNRRHHGAMRDWQFYHSQFYLFFLIYSVSTVSWENSGRSLDCPDCVDTFLKNFFYKTLRCTVDETTRFQRWRCQDFIVEVTWKQAASVDGEFSREREREREAERERERERDRELTWGCRWRSYSAWPARTALAAAPPASLRERQSRGSSGVQSPAYGHCHKAAVRVIERETRGTAYSWPRLWKNRRVIGT